jgi:hypothetical protein
VRRDHQRRHGERDQHPPPQHQSPPFGERQRGAEQAGHQDREVVAREHAEPDGEPEQGVGADAAPVPRPERRQHQRRRQGQRQRGVGQVEHQVPMEVQRRQHAEGGADREQRIGLQPPRQRVQSRDHREGSGEAQGVDHRQLRPGQPRHQVRQPVERRRVLGVVAPLERLGEEQRLEIVAAPRRREQRRLRQHDHGVKPEDEQRPGGREGGEARAAHCPGFYRGPAPEVQPRASRRLTRAGRSEDRRAGDQAGRGDDDRQAPLLIATEVALAPWGSLPRSDYTSKLVDWSAAS